jgi:hypothetical protein
MEFEALEKFKDNTHSKITLKPVNQAIEFNTSFQLLFVVLFLFF